MEIRGIHSTDLFTGAVQRPNQVLRVQLVNQGEWLAEGGEVVTVRADGAGVTTPEPVAVTGLSPGEQRSADIPLAIDAAYAEGTARPVTVTVTAEGAGGPVHPKTVRVEGEVIVAAPGWTMFLVPHFHYDPVWWNNQSGYTATWDEQLEEGQSQRSWSQRTALDLVRMHMDAARADSDYKFVLAELDYLKPYWDAFPQDRAELRQLIAEGRVELVGGMYNEPNTNLTSLESTIRNTIYGVGYQRDVVGGAPRSGWMLDVFGHDPSYPSVMADAGLTSSSWARGPFHQWGPRRGNGRSNTDMQFASEFEWVAPDGSGLLTSYMANHYSAGWGACNAATLAEAEAAAYVSFQELKPVATTRNVLLPVGADHTIPSKWATEIQRDWNKQYVWPKFVVGLPEEFFSAVRDDASRRGIAFSPQSRDMNPIYTGKDVSYIDTKQAQRAAEAALDDAERLATLMTVLGAGYPAEAVDKAWRLLCFGAHHDAVTGTESDQVYLDLLGGWREAYDLAAEVREEAIGYLADHVDTAGSGAGGASAVEGRPLLVVNTQSWARTDVASVTARFPAPGPAGVEVRDASGAVLPSVAEAAARHGDGTLAEVRLSFVAADVPATGYRVYRLVPTTAPLTVGWQPADGTGPAANRAESDEFLIEADPARGGALSSIFDKRAGRELLRPGEVGGELVAHEEYPKHPRLNEGPWHLVPNGKRQGTSSVPGRVRAEVSPAGQRLVSACRLGGLEITQEVTAWNGLGRLEFAAHVDGSIGHDRLLRARFPLAAAGALPVYETAGAAIGRTVGFPDVDSGVHPYTQDNPAYTWAGVSSAVRVALHDEAQGGDAAARLRHAIGVAEVVAGDDGALNHSAPDHGSGLRGLVAALAAQGVTATASRPDGPRYGDLVMDSNLPDARISVGGPGQNSFTEQVLKEADPRYATLLTERLAAAGRARVWVPAARDRAATLVPGADLRGARDLPVLIVAGAGEEGTAAAVADLIADLADATIEVTQPASLDGTSEPLGDHSVALLNRGTPGTAIEQDGTVHISLMRSCSEWPSGIWVEPPKRTVPDGSSFSWQHWSHTFEYALASGAGDWRGAGFTRAGHAYNHPFQARVTAAHDGELPPSASLLEAGPGNVVLTALKPRGNPLATGAPEAAENQAALVLRCRETDGQAVSAEVRAFVPLRDGRAVTILEEERGALDTAGGTLRMDLGPARTATATVIADADPRRDGPVPASPVPDSRVLGPRREVAHPVYTRYWLHNAGPAPMGNQLVGVYAEPPEIDLSGLDDQPVPVQVTVSATRAAAGTVELIVPPCARLARPGDLRYHLAAGEHQRFEVPLRPRDGAVAGVYHLRARITDELGQTLEDIVTVRVGGGGDYGTEALDARLDTRRLSVAAGGSAVLRVQLANASRDEVTGQAQLLSPYGTWHLTTGHLTTGHLTTGDLTTGQPPGRWTQGFAVPPGGQATLAFDLRAPAHARPMEAWALVKVMAAGRTYYTEPASLTVPALR